MTRGHGSLGKMALKLSVLAYLSGWSTIAVNATLTSEITWNPDENQTPSNGSTVNPGTVNNFVSTNTDQITWSPQDNQATNGTANNPVKNPAKEIKTNEIAWSPEESQPQSNGTDGLKTTKTTGVSNPEDANFQPQSQVVFSGFVPPKDPNCKVEALNIDTWKKLNLNDRMKKIPGGDKMSVTNYANQLQVSNFICGLGGNCNSGQPCYPLPAQDWYILFAIQQWNTYTNIYYDAVAYAVSAVQNSLNSLIASLFPASDNTAIRNMKSNLGIQASLSLVMGTVIMDVLLLFGAAGTGPWMLFFNSLNFVMVAGMSFWALSIKMPPEPMQDGFDQWAKVAFYLENYKEQIHQRISDESKKRLTAGISTDEGMFGAIKDGHFLEPAKMSPLPQVEEKLKKIIMALGINMVLNNINAFITVGQNKDSCRDKGKNGAWPGPHTLSWCTEVGGVMHNIVIAKDDKTYNEINNANAIEENFGFATEAIIKSSMACQALGKGFRFVPWQNDAGAVPKSAEDVCVFNLPVCELKDKVKEAIDDGGRTAKACRKDGGLPI